MWLVGVVSMILIESTDFMICNSLLAIVYIYIFEKIVSSVQS